MADEGKEDPVVAANLRRLMRRQRIGGVGALRSAMAQRGFKIGAGTIQRALKGGDRNRVETLGKLAEFFDVTTDQLLQPDLGADGAQQEARGAPATDMRAVSDTDRQLLEDFQVLMEDDQATFAREIAMRAAKMRAHNAKVLQMASSATDRKAGSDDQNLTPDEQFTTADEGHMPHLHPFGPSGAEPKVLRKKG